MANKVISLEQAKFACKNCGLGELCLPLGLSHQDIEQLNAIVKRGQPIHKGDHLFEVDQKFTSIYVIKAGAIKTYTQCANGNEKVIGFYLPGEVIGLDGISTGYHICSARALETTALCELPFEQLEMLTAKMPNLQHHIFRLMGQEISKDTGVMTLLGKSTAEGRLAAFLVSLSVRFYNRGFSSSVFNLSMSRQEIGSYLGLALETVSRLFTHFQEQKILRVDRKHIEILDMERLYELLDHQSTCAEQFKLIK